MGSSYISKDTIIHKDLKYISMDRELALEQLMTMFGEEIKRLVYLYVKDWSLADDITQEVFVSIFLKLDTYSGNSSIKRWIYSIAINKSKDYLRSWYYRKMISTNVRTFFEKGTKRSTPELQMIEQDENSILYKNILSLPIKYREVLILYYYKELSVDEISKLMDLNVSSVKTRLRRSREKLKQLLPNEKGSEFIGS